jgi:ATP-binding cassette subfamily F protein 3
MSLIVTEQLEKSFGTNVVLQDVNVRLGQGERVGLVGPNGQGKSTLLRLFLGIQEPTSGRIQTAKGVCLGYLPQDPPDPRDETLWDAMLRAVREITRLEEQMLELQEQLAGQEQDARALARFGQVQLRFESLGGYSYQTRLEMLLEGLGFDKEQFHQPLGQFSGGQRSRAMLAELLAGDPDVLLLDEPTNHLDMETVEWLEAYLCSCKAAMIVVSHDRYFLDRLVEHVWEVSFGLVQTYRGNYSAYVRQRHERFEERMRQWRREQEYIEKTQEFIRRNLAGQRTKEAQGRRSRLERFLAEEAIERPREHREIHVRFAPRRRSGDLVLRAEDLQAGYDPDQVLVESEQLEIRRGERLAILGPNGSGKTTLLRTLMGQLEALSGTIRLGANVEVGYLSQTHAELIGEDDLITSVRRDQPQLKTEEVRDLLGSLHFGQQEVHRRIDELSGGQRSRMVLARLIASGANVLVLDEPTNHLDLPTCEALQEALGSFEGTVIMVSHDRYLIQAVATRVWLLEDGGIRQIPGSWQDVLRWRERRASGDDSVGSGPSASRQVDRCDKRASYEAEKRAQRQREKLHRDHQKIEKRIHELETRLRDLTRDVNRASEAGDMEQVESLGKEYSRLDTQLQQQWKRWEEVGLEIESRQEG